jgi:hypothetical protein
VFVDSITVAGRLCLQWCKGQPQAFSEKTGKPDSRGAYGLMGQEMIAWLTHLQHTRGKNVWFVGILDEKLDDFNRRVFSRCRSTAPRPAWSCPASSMKSSPWPN